MVEVLEVDDLGNLVRSGQEGYVPRPQICPGRTSMPHALLVENAPSDMRGLAVLVERRGFTIAIATDASSARRALDSMRFEIMLLDVHLQNVPVIDHVLEMHPQERPRIALMSADETVQTAVSVLPLENARFLRKPIVPNELDAFLTGHPHRRVREPRRETEKPQLIGNSMPMLRLKALLHKVERTELSVYIEGESGTGKELVARAIHYGGSRAKGPFVAVNCGALPASLIDSELFGHERGSFTGADRAREGVFEQASGGTLFLDEIAEMPQELQVRLLRTLETGLVRRVGGKCDIQVDVRIISATNRPFDQSLASGRLREDIFHRLCVFPIVVPPLRDRGDDIELLARCFLKQFSGVDLEIGPNLLGVLRRYHWPGNVRQLRNAVQHAVVMIEGDRIEVGQLPENILQAVGTPATSTNTRRGSASVAAPEGRLDIEVGMSIAEAERRLIEATLARMAGDKRLAAEILGVSLRTLYSRLNDYARERLIDTH